MRGWRAWVWDGEQVSRHSSADLRWQELPPKGVVGVVVYLDPPYRRVIDGHDWIWLEDGAFFETTTADEWGEWAEKPEVSCGSCLKRGAGMPDDLWTEVQREMIEAREAP